MSKATHPYFIANDPDRKTTATMLVGTADEFGIDQHSIQMVQGGFNVTEELARAIYGEDFDADEDEQPEEPVVQETTPGEPIVTGSPKSGDATVAAPIEPVEEPVEEPAEEPVAPEHQQGETVDYTTWDYADLQSAVATRGIETTDRKGPTLAAALAAADAEGDDTL